MSQSLPVDDDSRLVGTGPLPHDTCARGRPPMSIVDSVLTLSVQFVDAVGYPGITAVMLAESVLPIPSTVVLPVIGLQVGSGALLFFLASLAATLGSVAGAWGLYRVGRAGGRRAALRLPAWVGVTEQRLAGAEPWFERWGDAVVLLGRLVPGVRSVVSIPAGTLHMPVARFLVLTFLGSLGWNASLIWVGWALASRWEAVAGGLSTASTYGLVAV